MAKMRFSVAAIMAFVAILAVGMAALHGANETWILFLGFLVLGVLVFAIVAAFDSSGSARRFWTGFALFGWVYFLCTPTFTMATFIFDIPSEVPLDLLYSKIARIEEPKMDPMYFVMTIRWDKSVWCRGVQLTDSAQIEAAMVIAKQGIPKSYCSLAWDPVMSQNDVDEVRNTIRDAAEKVGFTFGSEQPLQTNPNVDIFHVVGNLLLSLIVALIGGMLARFAIGRNAGERLTKNDP